MLSTCCVIGTKYPLKASCGSTEVMVTMPSSDLDLRIIEIEMMGRTQKGGIDDVCKLQKIRP